MIVLAKIAGASLCESSDTCSMTPQKTLLAHGMKLAYNHLHATSEVKSGQKMSTFLDTDQCTDYIDGALDGVSGVAAKMQTAALLVAGHVGGGVGTLVALGDAIFGGVLVPDQNEIRISALEKATRCLNDRLNKHEERLNEMSSKLQTTVEISTISNLKDLEHLKNAINTKTYKASQCAKLMRCMADFNYVADGNPNFKNHYSEKDCSHASGTDMMVSHCNAEEFSNVPPDFFHSVMVHPTHHEFVKDIVHKIIQSRDSDNYEAVRRIMEHYTASLLDLDLLWKMTQEWGAAICFPVGDEWSACDDKGVDHVQSGLKQMRKLISAFGENSKIVFDAIENGDTAEELKRAVESKNTGVKSDVKTFNQFYGSGCMLHNHEICKWCSQKININHQWHNIATKAGGKYQSWPKDQMFGSWLQNYLNTGVYERSDYWKKKINEGCTKEYNGPKWEKLMTRWPLKTSGCQRIANVQFRGFWDGEKCLQHMKNECEHEPCLVSLKSVYGYKRGCEDRHSTYSQSYERLRCGFIQNNENPSTKIITYELHYSAIAEQKPVFINARKMLLDSIKDEDGVLPPYISAVPPPQKATEYSIHFRKMIGLDE